MIQRSMESKGPPPSKPTKWQAVVGAVTAPFIELRRIFREGDLWTRLSALIMGLGSMAHGQIIKGLLYLGFQVGLFAFQFFYGFSYLRDFSTLGVNAQARVWDEALQIYRRVPGDNSLLILLFGMISIAAFIPLLVFWRLNLKSSFHAQQLREEGKKPNTFLQDVKTLLDERFHISLLSLPMTLLTIFTILPLLFMILIAFTNFDKNHQPPGTLFTWIGLTNITDVFWGNPLKSNTFFGILGWTVVWAIFATFTNYILGMILAMMINKKGIRLKKMWRTIFVITVAIPQFVSLLMVSRMLTDTGVVNVLLQQLGLITTPIPFLTDGNLARIVVIVVNIWVGIPYTMLITTGILMNIPADLYESASIDGAGPMRQFVSITVPYMLFVTGPYLITTFVSNINNFNVIFLLTTGGPFSLDYYQGGKTDLLVTWLYKLTVDRQDYSLAATIGIFIFLLVSTFSLIVYNLSGSVKKEDEFQ